MLKTSLKLGLAVLIAASTMLAPKAANAAHGSLCVYSYTLPDGETCTYSGLQGGCCAYTSDGGSHCSRICSP